MNIVYDPKEIVASFRCSVCTTEIAAETSRCPHHPYAEVELHVDRSSDGTVLTVGPSEHTLESYAEHNGLSLDDAALHAEAQGRELRVIVSAEEARRLAAGRTTAILPPARLVVCWGRAVKEQQ